MTNTEKKERINALKNAINALKAEINKTRAQLVELKATVVEDPISEETGQKMDMSV